jgi:glutathione S-transferase
MYRLYGFFTQNSMKTLYVLEELGIDFEFHFVNLMKGEQMSDEFRQKTPVGKVPLLEHNGEYLFESGAICRYVANVENSSLYPQDKLQRARVDQWLDYFSVHLGHWLTTLYWEKIIKVKAGLGETNEVNCKKALKFAHPQMTMVHDLLGHSNWLANDSMSIADLFAFAYIEQFRAVEFPLDDYAHVRTWFDRIESRPGITRARGHVGQ